jgi:hypothetical protein
VLAPFASIPNFGLGPRATPVRGMAPRTPSTSLELLSKALLPSPNIDFPHSAVRLKILPDHDRHEHIVAPRRARIRAVKAVTISRKQIDGGALSSKRSRLRDIPK